MDKHFFAPFMREALTLAEQGRWVVAPNPTVGAVLVRNGEVVARGWHAAYGEAHAEVQCLKHAVEQGVQPAECTLVVTLEPCNHTGKTPPCTAAILEAGIQHVVVGAADPNPQAAGGADFLREHGVTVEMGIEETRCTDAIADFSIWQTTDRPYVLLKLACTLDGRIATRTGQSKWISDATALQKVHALRAGIAIAGGVVLVGSNTLLADNPALTARLEDGTPAAKQPLAAVLSSRVPTSDSLCLTTERAAESIFFTTTAGAATSRAAVLRERGAKVIGLEDWKSASHKDIHEALRWLRDAAKCRYVLCEGGGKMGLSLLEAGLVDEFRLHISPLVLGDAEARPLFAGRTPVGLDEALALRITQSELCGTDCLLTLRPRLSA